VNEKVEFILCFGCVAEIQRNNVWILRLIRIGQADADDFTAVDNFLDSFEVCDFPVFSSHGVNSFRETGCCNLNGIIIHKIHINSIFFHKNGSIKQ
jgi:hypothetical protein